MRWLLSNTTKMSDCQDESPRQLLPCPTCPRTFLPEVLERHYKVCEKTAHKKRRVFDSFKARVTGTELEEFFGPAPLPGQAARRQDRSPVRKPSAAPSKWRQTHENLIAALRAARGDNVTAPAVQPQGDQCPSCSRFFGPRAFDRHVEFCREKQSRMKQAPAKMSQALERLEARTKYRAPMMVKPKMTVKEKYSPMPTRKAESLETNLHQSRPGGAGAAPPSASPRGAKPAPRPNPNHFSRQSPARVSARQRSLSPAKKSASSMKPSGSKMAVQPRIKETLKDPDDMRPRTAVRVPSQDKMRFVDKEPVEITAERKSNGDSLMQVLDEQMHRIRSETANIKQRIEKVKDTSKMESNRPIFQTDLGRKEVKEAPRSRKGKQFCQRDMVFSMKEEQQQASRGEKYKKNKMPPINDLSVNEQTVGFGVSVAACGARPQGAKKDSRASSLCEKKTTGKKCLSADVQSPIDRSGRRKSPPIFVKSNNDIDVVDFGKNKQGMKMCDGDKAPVARPRVPSPRTARVASPQVSDKRNDSAYFQASPPPDAHTDGHKSRKSPTAKPKVVHSPDPVAHSPPHLRGKVVHSPEPSAPGRHPRPVHTPDQNKEDANYIAVQSPRPRKYKIAPELQEVLNRQNAERSRERKKSVKVHSPERKFRESEKEHIAQRSGKRLGGDLLTRNRDPGGKEVEVLYFAQHEAASEMGRSSEEIHFRQERKVAVISSPEPANAARNYTLMQCPMGVRLPKSPRGFVSPERVAVPKAVRPLHSPDPRLGSRTPLSTERSPVPKMNKGARSPDRRVAPRHTSARSPTPAPEPGSRKPKGAHRRDRDTVVQSPDTPSPKNDIPEKPKRFYSHDRAPALETKYNANDVMAPRQHRGEGRSVVDVNSLLTGSSQDGLVDRSSSESTSFVMKVSGADVGGIPKTSASDLQSSKLPKYTGCVSTMSVGKAKSCTASRIPQSLSRSDTAIDRSKPKEGEVEDEKDSVTRPGSGDGEDEEDLKRPRERTATIRTAMLGSGDTPPEPDKSNGNSQCEFYDSETANDDSAKSAIWDMAAQQFLESNEVGDNVTRDGKLNEKFGTMKTSSPEPLLPPEVIVFSAPSSGLSRKLCRKSLHAKKEDWAPLMREKTFLADDIPPLKRRRLSPRGKRFKVAAENGTSRDSPRGDLYGDLKPFRSSGDVSVASSMDSNRVELRKWQRAVDVHYKNLEEVEKKLDEQFKCEVEEMSGKGDEESRPSDHSDGRSSNFGPVSPLESICEMDEDSSPRAMDKEIVVEDFIVATPDKRTLLKKSGEVLGELFPRCRGVQQPIPPAASLTAVKLDYGVDSVIDLKTDKKLLPDLATPRGKLPNEKSLQSVVELWKARKLLSQRQELDERMPVPRKNTQRLAPLLPMAVLPVVLRRKIAEAVAGRLERQEPKEEAYDPLKQAERQMFALLTCPSTNDFKAYGRTPASPSSNRFPAARPSNLESSPTSAFTPYSPSGKDDKLPKDVKESVNKKLEFGGMKSEGSRKKSAATDYRPNYSAADDWEEIFEKHFDLNRNETPEKVSVRTALDGLGGLKKDRERSVSPRKSSGGGEAMVTSTPSSQRAASTYRKDPRDRNSAASLSGLSFCSQVSDATIADEDLLSGLEVIGVATPRSTRKTYARSQSVFEDRNRMLFAKTLEHNISSSDENETEKVLPTVVDRPLRRSPIKHLYPNPKSAPSHYLRSQSVSESNCKLRDRIHTDEEDHGSSPEGNKYRKSKMSGDSAYSSLNRRSPYVGQQERLSSSGSDNSLPPLGQDPHTDPKGVKMSKFCHECGYKYPVAIAKFCCECGVRRLVI